MLEKLKRIQIIVSKKTVVVTCLAIASTFLCSRYDITADFPLTLIATAIIFPIVFSIGGAYKRRETALDRYGIIKAHGRALYFAARDWLENSDPQDLEDLRNLLEGLLKACRTLFAGTMDTMSPNEEQVYRRFSELSGYIKERMRQKGLASGEVSRCNQFLSKMLIAFENIKHIYQYRTPRTLRAFSSFFITLLPPLYGPYFALIARDYSNGLQYAMPILFSVILVSLDNIQEHLENPFDQIGEDDVMINAEKFVERLKLE